MFIIWIISPMFFVFCFVSVVIPLLHWHTHASSCPMVSTTTALKILPTCIAMAAVWAQAPAPPSRSSQFHLHPPPPHLVPPVRGHVPPQLCYQTTLPTVHWAPWSLHHESRVGRFVPSPGCWWSFPPPPLSRTYEFHDYWWCFSLKDWAKPGPYDQPMVNTLRRRKDKDPAAVPDINGSGNDGSPAMTLTQAPSVLQTSVSVEERNKALIPPVKVRFGNFYIWFIAGFYLRQVQIRHVLFAFCAP